MQQFVLAEKNLRAMLNKAFNAGFTCPLDMMDSEIANIYNEYISGQENICPCNPPPPKIKPEKESDIETLKALFEDLKQQRLF
jgi:hypothetical protein